MKFWTEGDKNEILEAMSTASREAQQYEELRRWRFNSRKRMRASGQKSPLIGNWRKASQKEEVLESRDNEVNDLKSKIDGHAKQMAELELTVEGAKVEAAGQAERADHLAESFKAKVPALEGQLRDTEENVRKQESTIKGLEQNLTAKIQDFESQVRNKEELLAGRDAKINDLKSQLNLLTKGIGEMSSFFKQAEALAAAEGQGVGTAVLNESLKQREEKPATFQSKSPRVTPIVPDAPREIVSPDLFYRITGELTEVKGIVRPMASIIVRDHVLALGESMEKFPKTRLPELLESLSKEITDEDLKIDFRKRLAQNAQIVGEATF